MTDEPKGRFRWNYSEVWACLGVCAAVIIVLSALFYGYSL